MKKMILLTLTLALALSLAACGGKTEPASEAGILPDPAEEPGATVPGTPSDLDAPANLPNPMVSYDTLEEINEAVGCRLCAPAVMGVTDKAYFVINNTDGKMADERFTVAGQSYSFRCAPVADHDISGLWIGENGTAFEGMEISDELQYAEDDSFKAARWFTIDGQYVLSVNDNGTMEKDTFLAIAEELRAGTQPGMSEGELAAYYADLEGSYADTVSQRALAEVTANGSEGVTIVVHWASSAYEYDQWTIDVRLTEDGLLSYQEENHSHFTAAADCSLFEEVQDIAAVAGWFEYVDGQLLWTGANDEQCRACAFEKIADAPTLTQSNG